MAAPRRLHIQIFVDVLRAIHWMTREGNGVTLYRIERIAGLTHDRLRESLLELQAAGLVDAEIHVTPRGYDFLNDITHHVMPTLEKYGFWRGPP